jgi:hypothetical protein
MPIGYGGRGNPAAAWRCRGRPEATDVIWRRGSKGLQRSRVVALAHPLGRVTPRRRATATPDRELPVRWLLAEWPVGQPEPVK